uniref:Bacteriophage head to tail connecting protein n=1 Tax=Desulfovibrio sp. U5L TaxID=596152 RepID=I2Q1E6_9BACT
MAEERLAALASQLVKEFEQDKRDRQPLEQRWLEDYRLYMGIYDPGVKIKKGKSRLFLNKCRTKTDTVVARLMDILFPRAGDRNWDIQPTPEPTLDAATMGVVDYVRQTRGEDAAQEILTKEAGLRATRMAKVMADQLAESPDRVAYRATTREIVRSAAIYGMGIHKGPLVDEQTRKTWKLKLIAETGADGQAVQREAWVLDQTPVELRPYFRSVSIWNFFWDMTAKTPRDCRRMTEEYLMTYGDVLDLAKRKSFFGDVIREYVRQNKEGDATERPYESELRRIGDKNNERQIKNRFRVLERWGWLRGDELADAGVDLGEDPVEEDYFCNIWLLGGKIIKAVRAPIRGVEFPFQIFAIEKDESGICGQGIPRLYRHPQIGFNAMVRGMVDNAAIATGPIIGVSKGALSQTEDIRDIHAFKLFEFESDEDMRGAITFWQAQSHTSEFLAMGKFFSDAGEEITVPSWVHGDGNVSDAAKTLGGLSMLMSAMQVNLAEMVKTFDDDVTAQFITALYFWNMDFNPRKDIKGDFNIVAMGSTALMQKEVQSQRLIQFLQLAASLPALANMVNFQETLREIAVSLQVSPKLVFDDATIQQNQMQQMTMQVQAEQQAKLETVLNAMQARGEQPAPELQQMLAEVLRQAAGQQGQAPAALPAGQPEQAQPAAAAPPQAAGFGLAEAA